MNPNKKCLRFSFNFWWTKLSHTDKSSFKSLCLTTFFRRSHFCLILSAENWHDNRLRRNAHVNKSKSAIVHTDVWTSSRKPCYLAIAFPVSVMNFPDELGTGAGHLFSNFEELSNRVVFQRALRGHATALEFREHRSCRHWSSLHTHLYAVHHSLAHFDVFNRKVPLCSLLLVPFHSLLTCAKDHEY